MTDKELLELAAKACGFEVRIYSGMCVDRGTDCVCVTKDGLKWNPLTDDGDALRLAVELELELWFGGGGLNAGGMTMDIEEDYGQDPFAATRRSIVRAAAEIGKAKREAGL